jgi:hypothetical protein
MSRQEFPPLKHVLSYPFVEDRNEECDPDVNCEYAIEKKPYFQGKQATLQQTHPLLVNGPWARQAKKEGNSGEAEIPLITGFCINQR